MSQFPPSRPILAAAKEVPPFGWPFSNLSYVPLRLRSRLQHRPPEASGPTGCNQTIVRSNLQTDRLARKGIAAGGLSESCQR